MRRTGYDVYLLMLDLDGFKAVNDDFGHPAGDTVLREVAVRLCRLSRRTDYLARLGGDEFAIVISDPHDREGLLVFARRLIAGISEPFDVSGQAVRIGVSIGIGTANTHQFQEYSEIVAATDSALYKVKKGSKNDFVVAA